MKAIENSYEVINAYVEQRKSRIALQSRQPDPIAREDVSERSQYTAEGVAEVAAQLPPPAAMQKAVAALDAVKQYMQETVAPALKVTLGFSDADGD